MTDQLLVPRELLERLTSCAMGLMAVNELRELLAQPAASEPKPAGVVVP